MIGLHKFRMVRLILFVMLLVSLTSGCMYKNQIVQESPIQVKESMVLVQQAINDFHDKTGVLPIKTKPMDTPIFEKYVIDFNQLMRGGYLGNIPTTAYEKGGTFVYVFVDVETKPTVKLFDLVAVQDIGEIQQLVNVYKQARGELPIDIDLDNGYYSIDYQLLKTDAKQIKSRYSSQFLGLMMDEDGTVSIDYAPEIMKQMQTLTANGKKDAMNTKDLRTLLVDHSFFVPVLSVPYELKNNEPIPVIK